MLVGFSKKCITPPDSCRMAGFDLRKQPSQGVLDDLYVSCVALQPDKGAPFAFLSFDLLGVPREECRRIEEELKTSCGFYDPTRIWISATHTHAAPSHIFGREGALDEPYLSFVRGQAASAAREALRSAGPCEAYVATGEAGGIASLRDVPREKAGFSMPLAALKFCGEKDKVLARFQCHCTVLDEKNLLVSADLAGAARQALGTDAVLVNGACADLSTRFTRLSATPKEIARLGSALADAMRGLRYRHADRRFTRFTAQKASVTLPQSQILTEAEKAKLRNEIAAKLSSCPDEAQQREMRSILAVLDRPPRERENTRTVDIHAAYLLGIVLIGLPFEMNSGDAALLEREMSLICNRPVYVICYTGGYDGYLPSGRPISADSNYQDIASPYAPETIPFLYHTIEIMVRTLTGKGFKLD